MLFKVLLCFCLFQVMVFATQLQPGWIKIASTQCVGAKHNDYREFTYNGPSICITSMRIVHKSGTIGCYASAHTYWGCDNKHPLGIIVTDTQNKRIYPSPRLYVSIDKYKFYSLPGYTTNSPELVFSDLLLRNLYHNQKLRIWYGEDLLDITESDNHGQTCMDVYVYMPDNKCL